MQGTANIAANNLTKVTAAIYTIGNPMVSEAYSKFDANIVNFHSAEALNKYIYHGLQKDNLLTFSIYYPDTQGFRNVEKIALSPEKCDGHTYRHAVHGWGVIQFQLTRQLDNTIECYFGVNSEKRASTWFANFPALKSPNLWNWSLVEKHIRRLSREVKKYALPHRSGSPPLNSN
ncbi:MAG: hypothetical protein WBP13_10100 [Methylophilaceae bacterium]